MTVSTTTRSAVFPGNGAADTFDYSFKVLAATDLTVQRLVNATGLVDKTYTAGEYTVTGAGTNSGSVHLLAGPLAAGYSLIVTRTVVLSQLLDIVNQTGFYPETVEDQLDRIVMGVQQVSDDAARSIKVAPGETLDELPSAVARAGQFPAFDANGDLILSSGTGTDAAFRTDAASAAGGSLIGLGQWSVADRFDNYPHAFDEIPAAMHNGIMASTNTDDVAGYLNTLLALGAPVIVPSKGLMWIATPLFAARGGGLIGHSFGCTIKAKANFGDFSMIYNSTLDPANDAARDTGLTFSGFKLDGNRANNATATELGGGIRLQAVDGAYLDVWTVDMKGDGVLVMYAYPYTGGGGTHINVGCRNIRGFIRSERCFRQGVAIVSAENCDLSIDVIDAGYYGLDCEPDDSTNFVRDCHFRVRAKNCGLNPTGSGGIASVSGTNSSGTGTCDVRNITIDFYGRDCNGIQFGSGINYRDVDGLFLRGRIDNQTGNGIGGLDSVGISRVNIDVAVKGGTGSGASLAGAGDIINGSIRVVSPGGNGVIVNDASGGVLQVRVENAAQFGLVVGGATSDMIFPNCEITGSGSSGVLIQGTANGNRFPNLRSTGALAFGYGVQETAGNNNRITNAALTNNNQGPATLTGATSFVEMEPLFGKATYDAPSIAAAGTATTTITVTGAAVGDEARVTFGVSLGGLQASAYVSAANTVTVVLQNPTAGAIDLASTTIRATVWPRVAV